MCNHDGTCSGELRFDKTKHRLIRLLVCDECNQIVRGMGSEEHTVNPALAEEKDAA
jgi:Fe2+ or Zn2+ uptake regulation protein